MSSAAARTHVTDPYALRPSDIADPPHRPLAILRRIGPGLILSASIVGSGELIATTTLGAEVGYVALWVILLSCFIKPAVQAELGRYSIATGQTGMEGVNQVPGPRLRLGWVVWLWVIMIGITRFQIGAMFGGVAQVLSQIVPGVPVSVWVAGLLGLTLFLLIGGGYERVERLAMIKVGLFTMLTFLCAMLLMRLPEYFSWGALAEGLKFDLPANNGLATAIAVFGITGVGASELFMYPYWCVEKGYARYAGPRDGTPEWRSRAAGWIRVMNVDIVASMVIYTVATIAFYLLGAGILHGQGVVPAAQDMIPVLSRMYTQTLGPWALWLFYAGAIATLYGTIFAATAAESRVMADVCRVWGRFDKHDYAARVRHRNIFVVILAGLGAGFYLIFQSPVNMVRYGGLAQAMMLPVISVAALYLRHRRLPPEAHPGPWHTAGLWVAAILICLVMVYYLALSLR